MYNPGPVHDRFVSVNPPNEGQALRSQDPRRRGISGDGMLIRFAIVLVFLVVLFVFLLLTTPGN
ncbi:MAG: hypothetical protein FI707_06755 [SAR202 cluster bacterium]|jgi:hypothetical protein|nr:hypothetical protein [Chloroflexota bacterium]MDP6420673.1 hypothetical protein [SAR202 cluster bacterium]HAL47368.1 hypothetical protein [Dehalococcoidia bacterium]MDP6662736.1 hypothetical protein [SAR202 cluster bacterium]MDP6799135.1 hypothetical protein [SAR202 cluster bacterium]|tara:strand:+ start:4342 stop:4533 length:192 start_codon:yes stop_codon:yes gene_type:complete